MHTHARTHTCARAHTHTHTLTHTGAHIQGGRVPRSRQQVIKILQMPSSCYLRRSAYDHLARRRRRFARVQATRRRRVAFEMARRARAWSLRSHWPDRPSSTVANSHTPVSPITSVQVVAPTPPPPVARSRACRSVALQPFDFDAPLRRRHVKSSDGLYFRKI